VSPLCHRWPGGVRRAGGAGNLHQLWWWGLGGGGEGDRGGGWRPPAAGYIHNVALEVDRRTAKLSGFRFQRFFQFQGLPMFPCWSAGRTATSFAVCNRQEPGGWWRCSCAIYKGLSWFWSARATS